VPFEASGGHWEVQVAIWRSRWPFGAPGGHLEVQVAVWSSRWPFGAPGGRLELQVAAPRARGFAGLCRRVAACGSGVVPLILLYSNNTRIQEWNTGSFNIAGLARLVDWLTS